MTTAEQKIAAAKESAAKTADERENIKVYLHKKRRQLRDLETTVETFRQHMLANGLAIPDVPLSGNGQVGTSSLQLSCLRCMGT